MSNTKDNRRVQYTKAALERSLLSLLKEKPIEKITVKEICENADINRGTFYSYYDSPAQLLTMIEDKFYVGVLSSVLTFQSPQDVVDIFTRGLTALKEHGELSSVLFGEHCDSDFLSKLVDVAKPICLLNWNKVSPEVPQELLDKLYSFVSYGCMNVIHRWLLDGMTEPPRKMAEFLNEVCNNGVLAFIQL